MDYADQLDMMDDDCDIQGFPIERLSRMENKLLPCPFCGGKPNIHHDDEEGAYWVICPECGAKTLTHYYSLYNEMAEKYAISVWNRRASPANPPLTLEQLQEMNGDMETRPWVWIEMLVEDKRHKSAYYQIQHDYTKGEALCCGYPGMGYEFEYEDYNETWLAYAHKPEKEA